MNLKRTTVGVALIAGIAIGTPSCKSQAARDAEAKVKIEAILPAGVTADVNNGVATLQGSFPDDAAKAATEESVKAIDGVKSISDDATVTPPPAPVQITPDQQLTTDVMSEVSNYPGVSASVTNGVVTLTGTIKRSDLPQLLQAINGLHPQKVENNLTIN
jgi:osmotically-inducible protein OsmY